MRGKWVSSGVDSATPSYCAFRSWHQSSSRLVTVFLGTLWCSIKIIEAPYLSDSELWIALHPTHGNQASSPCKGYVSWDFSSCGRNLGYILELQRGWPLETQLCWTKSGLLSSYDGHLRNLNEAWKDNTDASGVELGDQASVSSFQKDLGIPINFQEESGLVTFEALNFTSLSRCQEMWGPLSRWGGELGFCLRSPQRIQTSFHLERWKTNLHSRHFREIRPYF